MAFTIVFTPFVRFNPIAPTPAKASLGDCWDAATDSVENGLTILGMVANEDFLKCAGKVGSMDVVSIAVDAAFTVWGALGKFDGPETCTTAVKETIVAPLYDLLSNIPSDVTSFLDGILKLAGPVAVGLFNGIVDSAHQKTGDGPLTMADIIGAGVDYLYEILQSAIPTVFDYINCGCTMAGTALQVAKLTGEVLKETWDCAQTFCIVNCDDNPPYPPGVWQACGPGDRKWYNPGSVPGDGPFYESFGCNGCAAGSTKVTYSDFKTVTDTNWLGQKIQKQKEIARYDYCSCPAGEGYQQDGMVMGDYADSKGNKTGGQALVANYACKPCPPGAYRDQDGKACISCGAGKGAFSVSLFGKVTRFCQDCGKGQGTLADGTCGTCGSGEGVFAGVCGTCPEAAPRNKDGVCESCPPGTKYNPRTGTCGPICTAGKVWNPTSKEKDGCVSCSSNTEASYTLFNEPTGGWCPECERGWASTPGQECKPLNCQCLGADGHSCDKAVLVGMSIDGKNPVYACSATVEVPLKDPCPECRSKGKEERENPKYRTYNPKVKENPSDKYQTFEPKVKEKETKSRAPVLDLPGGGLGSQSPRTMPGPTGGGFKTMGQ